MVDYNLIDSAYIVLYKYTSCNYNKTPWFFDVAFYLLICRISMGQLQCNYTLVVLEL
jgi:hypothetical protein